jgi:hypothetical protein
LFSFFLIASLILIGAKNSQSCLHHTALGYFLKKRVFKKITDLAVIENVKGRPAGHVLTNDMIEFSNKLFGLPSIVFIFSHSLH